MNDSVPELPRQKTDGTPLAGEEAAQEGARITYHDFARVEMKVGEILSAERVEGSEKLLRLMVDVGEEAPRQILAGIRAWYPDPTALVGKRVPFVTNLQPRTIMGMESNGMLLAAHDGKHFSLLETDGSVAPGTRLS